MTAIITFYAFIGTAKAVTSFGCDIWIRKYSTHAATQTNHLPDHGSIIMVDRFRRAGEVFPHVELPTVGYGEVECTARGEL